MTLLKITLLSKDLSTRSSIMKTMISGTSKEHRRGFYLSLGILTKNSLLEQLFVEQWLFAVAAAPSIAVVASENHKFN